MPASLSPRVILVTGMSGAGKSSALKALEDIGFEAMDNVPLRFITSLASQPLISSPTQGIAPSQTPSQGLAIGVDVRARDFTPEAFLQLMQVLGRMNNLRLEVLFLDAEDEVLRRRFTETRRTHPLAQDRPVVGGIQVERQLLEPIKDAATVALDTSEMTGAELKQRLQRRYHEDGMGFAIQVVSFSFRRGLPRDADLVFDVRFLRNPHYDPQLRDHTGLEAMVGEYIEEDAAFAPFFSQLGTLLLPLMPRYLAEGKSYLTIAIGCTGGKHRSVHVAQKLAGFLGQHGYKTSIRHRDVAQHESNKVG
jgi:UPF0042 nucleotide-binding protein